MLKGDGYIWTFTGDGVRSDGAEPFDTAVVWQRSAADCSLLSLTGSPLPGNAVLELEYLQMDAPVQWLRYQPSGQYIPCAMDYALQETALILRLDAAGDYLLLYSGWES